MTNSVAQHREQCVDVPLLERFRETAGELPLGATAREAGAVAGNDAA